MSRNIMHGGESDDMEKDEKDKDRIWPGVVIVVVALFLLAGGCAAFIKLDDEDRKTRQAHVQSVADSSRDYGFCQSQCVPDALVGQVRNQHELFCVCRKGFEKPTVTVSKVGAE